MSASLPLLQRLVERAAARLLQRVARVEAEVLRRAGHLVLRDVGDVGLARAADALILVGAGRVAAVGGRLTGHPAPARDAARLLHPGVAEMHVALRRFRALLAAAADQAAAEVAGGARHLPLARDIDGADPGEERRRAEEQARALGEAQRQLAALVFERPLDVVEMAPLVVAVALDQLADARRQLLL